MPESERKVIQFELERMVNNSIKDEAARGKFDKIRYMQLVIQAMSTGKRYNDFQEALIANAAAFDRLQIPGSNAATISGEIRRTYFRGVTENVLVNGLARNDSQALASFLHGRLAQLKTSTVS
jgi:hypothetical protein